MSGKRCSQATAVITALSVLWAQTASAAGPVAAPRAGSVVRDVALDANGALRGQLVDAQGTGLAQVEVVLRQGEVAVAAALTDARGVFAFPRVAAGLYSVHLAPAAGADGRLAPGFACRLWAPGSAPPSAVPAVLLVADGDAIRGGIGGVSLLNPWVLGLITAAAIGIPLAMDKKSGS